MVRHLRKQQSTAGGLWSGLPLDVVRLLLAHLNVADRCRLALSSPLGRQWVQTARQSFRVSVRDQAGLVAACQQLAQILSLRSLRLLHLSINAVPGRLNLRCMALPQLEELALEDITANSRTLFYLSQLPRLTNLTLASTSDVPRHRINVDSDGGLRQLAACPVLRSLTLVNVQSDRGLDALTQLTALHLTLPDHVPDPYSVPLWARQDYMCENCGEVHPEDEADMLRAYTDWRDTVAVGPALRMLGGLQRLCVDFRGEGYMINVRLNTLDLGPKGCPCTGLTSLTSLALLNCSRADYTDRLLGAFNTLPALCQLQAQYEGMSYYLHWPAEGHKDSSGRPVVVTARRGHCWELERLPEAPAAEE